MATASVKDVEQVATILWRYHSETVESWREVAAHFFGIQLLLPTESPAAKTADFLGELARERSMIALAEKYAREDA